MNYNLKRGATKKMYKLKDISIDSYKDYVRKEPLIVVNETKVGKTIIGNNKIVVIGGDKPLITLDMGSDTVVENLDIISVQELIELHSKVTFLNRLKFLLTGNLTYLTKRIKKGHHNESTNQSLERRTTHEPINRNRTRNKPQPTSLFHSKNTRGKNLPSKGSESFKKKEKKHDQSKQKENQ